MSSFNGVLALLYNMIFIYDNIIRATSFPILTNMNNYYYSALRVTRTTFIGIIQRLLRDGDTAYNIIIIISAHTRAHMHTLAHSLTLAHTRAPLDMD